MAVCYSSIKHHKLKRRQELKERKKLEILKNPFINFLLAMVGKKLMYNLISITPFMETTLLIYAILKSAAIAIFFLVEILHICHDVAKCLLL